MRVMDKKPPIPIPPQHRHYPRTAPLPVRPGAGPRPGEPGSSSAGWSRAVPEGRRFPRGG
jgi:hypothetical protein